MSFIQTCQLTFCHICLNVLFVSACICMCAYQHSVFSEPFERRLQSSCPFTPKYFSAFSKNEDIFLQNYRIVTKARTFNIDTMPCSQFSVCPSVLRQFSFQSGIPHCIQLSCFFILLYFQIYFLAFVFHDTDSLEYRPFVSRNVPEFGLSFSS